MSIAPQPQRALCANCGEYKEVNEYKFCRRCDANLTPEQRLDRVHACAGNVVRATTALQSSIWELEHTLRTRLDKKPVIEIWAFEDAAKELQDLSPHGGDEDYIVILRNDDCSIAYQLEGGSFLGDDHWTKHEYGGEVIWIGAHA